MGTGWANLIPRAQGGGGGGGGGIGISSDRDDPMGAKIKTPKNT